MCAMITLPAHLDVSQLWWRTLAGRVFRTGDTLPGWVSYTRFNMDQLILRAPSTWGQATAEQDAREGFSKKGSTVMSTSTHSSHEQSGIGMNFHETSQKQAPWKSSGPVLPDSWSTDPCLQQGVKIVHSFSQVFNKFWDNCCFTRFTQSRRTNYVQIDPGPLFGRRRRSFTSSFTSTLTPPPTHTHIFFLFTITSILCTHPPPWPSPLTSSLFFNFHDNFHSLYTWHCNFITQNCPCNILRYSRL